MSIVFAAISPHPPLLLPKVGSKEDKEKVKNTLAALDLLAKKFKQANPDSIIISSPHEDWGFNVPLHFIAKDFKEKIETYLTSFDSTVDHFKKGKNFYQSKICNLQSKIALIASGDLSHRLKENGPYGFNPQGPKFDKALVGALEEKDIEKILGLEEIFPEAAECGLRSFCFLLGILEASGIKWTPEILSYEGPFGVGYLIANFKISSE